MTKYEWERQLKKGISGLPKSEQQRVLDYYNELFADKIDAGLREQYIISEFGNPYDVANKILVDYYNDGKENPAVDEYIYSSSDEIDDAFDEAPTAAVVEAPRRKTWTERREERREAHKVSHEEHENATYSDTVEYDTAEAAHSDDNAKRNGKGAKSASGLIVLLCILAYCVLGACFNLWHPGWLIFLVIPCVITLIEAINKRNWKIFAYPVFATLVFLLCGFYLHKWHPSWIIFITIPLYYVLGDFITKNADGNKTNKAEKKVKVEEPIQTADTAEKSKKAKRERRGNAANVITLIAKILMVICFVWVSIAVWSGVLSLFAGGLGMIAGGIGCLVQACVGASVNWMAVGAGLAILGLGLVCAFGMVALFKPCFNMCKSFVKTIRKSFDSKENA